MTSILLFKKSKKLHLLERMLNLNATDTRLLFKMVNAAHAGGIKMFELGVAVMLIFALLFIGTIITEVLIAAFIGWCIYMVAYRVFYYADKYMANRRQAK